MKYLAIIPNYWGKGDTPEEAMQNAFCRASLTRKQAKNTPRCVYMIEDDQAFIDELGMIRYQGAEPLLLDQYTID